jgi:hypothetical protein
MYIYEMIKVVNNTLNFLYSYFYLVQMRSQIKDPVLKFIIIPLSRSLVLTQFFAVSYWTSNPITQA